MSSSCSFIVSGILGSIFLFNTGWEYVFLLIGLLGLGWTLLVRCLVKRHQNQLRYKLLENGDLRDHRHAKPSGVGCDEVPWKLLLTQTPIM